MENKLGFGMMRLPQKKCNDSLSIDIDTICQMTDMFIEEGFNYFDTAYMYLNGKSEEVIKEVLSERYSRNKFILTTKLPLMLMNNKSQKEQIFQQQLNKCGVKYFDYYLLHCVNFATYKKAEEWECFDFLSTLKSKGLAHNIGFSYHDNSQLLNQILDLHPEIDVVQLQINYLDWEDPLVQSKMCYEVCVKHKKPVIVMEPVKGGTLATLPYAAEKLLRDYSPEESVASWAIRFVASLDNVLYVLSGMSNLLQVKDNIKTIKNFKPLVSEERKIIKKVVEIINTSIEIHCTGCTYCVAGCPMSIPIPNYFALYNLCTKFGGTSKEWFYDPVYINLIQNTLGSTDTEWFNYETYSKKGFGTAATCVQCGKCEKICPQHLHIPELMKKVSLKFDNKEI